MDGENNGKPYEQMDDLVVPVPLFLETPSLKIPEPEGDINQNYLFSPRALLFHLDFCWSICL